jgi:protein-S-isoprenylcysteine O-methyltransferase Ste14
MEKLELRLPPALIAVVFASLMYFTARLLPVGAFEFFGRQWLQWALLAMAFLTGLLAVLRFLREGASLNPHHPEYAKKLVTGGIYNYSRNPMYLSLLLLLLAWGLYLGNAFNTLLAALFVGYMNRFQIGPEEQVLASRFGAAYRQYCTLVRRWF